MAKSSKSSKTPKATKADKKPGTPAAAVVERPPSALDLAAKYLARCDAPKTMAEIAAAVIAAGWKTTGKTPAATINAAVIREIRDKGADSRFTKKSRGLFAGAGK